MTSSKLSESESVKTPVIFITGIGQTWSTLKNEKERWNLFPSSKQVIFNGYGAADYIKLISNAVVSVLSSLTGKGSARYDKILAEVMRYCVVDENRKSPADVNIRIYGARSFDRLKKVDFNSGEEKPGTKDSLFDRLIRDIPCEEMAAEIGYENLYCFNYCSFSDLYDDADALYKMIKDVIEDQKTKTGSKRVVLVPMSMGATVTTAFIDKYYDEAPELVEKVVSIVGAWDGSDALADLLTVNFRDNALDEIVKMLPSSAKAVITKLGKEKTLTIINQVVISLVRSVMLRTNSFMALVPKRRFNEVYDKYFTADNIASFPHLAGVKERCLMYHNAQENLKNNLLSLSDKISFNFICGYGLPFGGVGGEFGFLNYFKAAECGNSDSVVHISSTAPGTSFAVCSENLDSGERLSPDGEIDASTAWFPDNCWYFYAQEHELGTNNTALRLAGDIALGRVNNVNGIYPQFNKMRNLKGVDILCLKAEKAIKSGKLPQVYGAKLEKTLNDIKEMKNEIINNPEADNAIISKLREEVENILI